MNEPGQVAAPAVPQFWRCANGHVLGYVDGDTSRERLHIFARALERDDTLPVHTICEAYGTVSVTCSICGTHRTWRYLRPAVVTVLAST